MKISEFSIYIHVSVTSSGNCDVIRSFQLLFQDVLSQKHCNGMPHALKLLCSCDGIAKGDLGDDCKVLITKTCSQ